MFFIPNIIDNPSNSLYKLEEAEIYSLKEAKDLILLEKFSYSLFAIWNAIIINIQRRIEIFGIDIFLTIINEEERFNKEGNNLKDRWLNINEYNLIGYAQKLNIINHMTRDMITALYWMKSNTNENEIKKIDKEEIFAILFLIEKNLFLKEFKEDKRGTIPPSQNTPNLGRRKKDRQESFNAKPTTYHELLAKSGVKVFNDNLEIEKKNPKIIDGYI